MFNFIYIYISNLRSSITCSLLSEDIYLFFSILSSIPIASVSIRFVSKVFYGEFINTFVILSSYDLAIAPAILLPIRSSVASAVLNYFFWSRLSGSEGNCLAWLISFGLYLPLFTSIFSKRKTSVSFDKYTISWFNWIKCLFLYVTHQLITKVLFILSSISNGLEFWSVNHTSIYENSELNIFLVKYLIIDQMIYLEQMFARFLILVGNALILLHSFLNGVHFYDFYLQWSSF